MSLFSAVKDGVNAREAAQMYGVKVGRGSMTCCPFHKDRNPSMKIDMKRFHCFGCQADGDVIDFTARLFNLSAYDAAKKLAQDFGIVYDRNAPRVIAPPKREPSEKERFAHRLNECFDELLEERDKLRIWQEAYAPKPEDEDWDPRFAEAAMRLPIIENDLDILLSGDKQEKKLLLEEHEQKMEEQMKEAIVKTPVYYQSAAYAREHGELDQYRNSHWTNVACKNAIEDAISRNFDGMHLNDECVRHVLEMYGPERVQLVLAATVQIKAWDGRFSGQNKDWANEIVMPETNGTNGFDHKWDYEVSTHPAVLDGFISLTRKEIREMNRPSLRSELQKAEAGIPKAAPHKTKETEVAR